MLARGRAAHFFLLGEEHGIAENPKLAAALFRALVPAGYAKVAVEISPPMAAALDRALRDGGFDGLRRLLADEASRVAFFGMREEAEWLAAARAALPGGRPFLWGCDYEVGGDRHLIGLLKAKRKPAAAEAALAALEAASNASWARYHETRNPQFIYSFSGDPALVQAVRAAWPRADAEALAILETLEETFAINRLWFERRGFEFERPPRRLPARQFPAALAGRRRRQAAGVPEIRRVAYHPRPQPDRHVRHRRPGPGDRGAGGADRLPPAGAGRAGPRHRQFRSGDLQLPRRASRQYQEGMELLLGQAWPDAFTLFDTAPLRPIARSSARDLHPELARAIHGFDAILVMSGSTPSANLIEARKHRRIRRRKPAEIRPLRFRPPGRS